MSGVYISWPFCAQKCSYCNFASGVFPRELTLRYADALVSEIEGHEWDWIPETLYLGGGTPSALSPDNLQRVLSRIPGRPWAEATIEAAPGDGWRPQQGINRVSLGVQSFVRTELARTGRRHSAETVSDEIRLLRAAGLHNINIDLIAGLPGQTAASWRESLDWIERLAPPHVSVYILEIDLDSRLGRTILHQGRASDVPSEELTADLYEMAVERLASLGIRRYEISNFAVPGFESRHNLKYWRREPYMGFGSDAHSFDGRRRWRNAEHPSDYIAGCHCEFDSFDAVEEKFFVGLRLTEGIRPEPEEWRRYEQPIGQFVADGLLETDGAVLRLTSRGVLLSNELFQHFIGSEPAVRRDYRK